MIPGLLKHCLVRQITLLYERVHFLLDLLKDFKLTFPVHLFDIAPQVVNHFSLFLVLGIDELLVLCC